MQALNNYITTTRFGKNPQPSAEAFGGIFLGALSIGIYAFGNRLGLSSRNIQLLSGSSALFSASLLGHGAYLLSRKNKVDPQVLIRQIKNLFEGSDYSFDKLEVQPAHWGSHFGDLTHPVMKYFDQNGNLQIFIKVVATLTDEHIQELQKRNPKLGSNIPKEIEHVVVISMDRSGKYAPLRLKLGCGDMPKSLVKPIYVEKDCIELTDNNGKILENSQKTIKSLNTLIQTEEAEDTQGLVWQIAN